MYPPRPPIVGVAHIGLKVSDLAASREFYGHVLGYAEAFKLDKPDGSLMLVYFKVNDHQYIELFPTLKSPTEDRLSHIAFETTDARALRDYLAARGVPVPDRLKPGLDGDLSFMVTDPDGHRVEFMQYMPGSLHTRNFGKFLPAARISDHIQHVGITVKDQAAADKFYKDILGFRMGWHGGRNDQTTDWVDMVVPERQGLDGVHAERLQPYAQTTGRDAPHVAARAQRPGGLHDGDGARLQGRRAEGGPRRQVAA